MRSKGEREAVIACIIRERHPSVTLSNDYDMETARLVLNEISGDYDSNYIRVDTVMEIADKLCDLGGDIAYYEFEKMINEA